MRLYTKQKTALTGIILVFLATTLSLNAEKQAEPPAPEPQSDNGLFFSGKLSGKVRTGIDHLYNLEYRQAHKQFQSLFKAYEEHPAPWFFQAMIYWVKINNLDDLSESGRLFQKNIAIAIREAEKMLAQDQNNPAGYFYLAASLGFKGRYYLFDNEWYNAVITGLKAYRLLRQAEERNVPGEDIKLGLGIFNYFAARLPGPLKPAAKLVGIQGDLRTGLKQLHSVAAQGIFANIEARIVLATIYTYYTKKPPKGIAIFKDLLNQFPRNPFLHVALADAYLAGNQYSKALQKAHENHKLLKEKKINANWTFRIYAQLGKFYYARRSYKKALKYLSLAEKTKFRWPKHFVAWVYLRRANILKSYGYNKLALAEYKRAIEHDPIGKAASRARSRIEKLSR